MHDAVDPSEARGGSIERTRDVRWFRDVDRNAGDGLAETGRLERFRGFGQRLCAASADRNLRPGFQACAGDDFADAHTAAGDDDRFAR